LSSDTPPLSSTPEEGLGSAEAPELEHRELGFGLEDQVDEPAFELESGERSLTGEAPDGQLDQAQQAAAPSHPEDLDQEDEALDFFEEEGALSTLFEAPFPAEDQLVQEEDEDLELLFESHWQTRWRRVGRPSLAASVGLAAGFLIMTQLPQVMRSAAEASSEEAPKLPSVASLPRVPPAAERLVLNESALITEESGLSPEGLQSREPLSSSLEASELEAALAVAPQSPEKREQEAEGAVEAKAEGDALAAPGPTVLKEKARTRQAKKLNRRSLRKRLKLKLHAPAKDTAPKVALAMSAGQHQYLHGRYRAALKSYRKALKLDPKNSEVRYALALSELQLGKIRRSRVQIEELLEQSPENADAHLVLGFILQMGNKPSRAAEHYERYLKLAPEGEWAAELQALLPSLGSGV